MLLLGLHMHVNVCAHVCACVHTHRDREKGKRERKTERSVLLYNYACATYCCVKKNQPQFILTYMLKIQGGVHLGFLRGDLMV